MAWKKKDRHLIWDVDALFEHILLGMKKCKERNIVPVSMGIDTWAVDYVLLDDVGNRIQDVYGYRDSRTKGMDKEIYKTYIQEQPKFNISPSGKYAFVSSMLPHIDDKKCLGKIEILNFKTLKIIDEIKFYHIALYVMQAHFLEYNHQAYIIYQAHPYPCDLYNEKWSTYIYSIENKKIIYEAPFSFSLDYQEKRMRFILQRNKPRIETRFFELKDDLPPIEEILKEINKK